MDAETKSGVHTPGKWQVQDPLGDDAGDALWIVVDGESPEVYDWRCIAIVTSDDPDDGDNASPIGVAERNANARLIAAAPDHALIARAMTLGIARWDQGELCFGGMRYSTKLDEFGVPTLEAHSRHYLRAAIHSTTGGSHG